MNVSSYISRRYFFAKTSRNAVNIISGISILGILVGTLALIIVLSAFNGLEQLVTGFYNTFDPDLKVRPETGKYFDPDEAMIEKLAETEGVAGFSSVLEERVLLTFQDKEYIATVKGVDEEYPQVTNIREAVTHGEYALWPRDNVPGAILGAGVSYYLGYGRLTFEEPINIFVPRTGASASDFSNAFSSELLYPQGIFSVQPEFDEKFVIAPIDFVRDLLDQPARVSAIEINLAEDADVRSIKSDVKDIFGDAFSVKDRREQQAIFMKVMRNESLFTFLVFALILGIATFTIMGSLSMMMIDKKEHLRTLWSMGAELKTLRLIFFKEGLLISGAGAIFGLLLGTAIVWAQQNYGWLGLGQGYVVDSYPVVLKWRDVLLVLVTVGVLCSIASWLTSRRLTLKLINSVSK